eukprot:jgi/Ulvmu1/9181/UM005_0281.1
MIVVSCYVRNAVRGLSPWCALTSKACSLPHWPPPAQHNSRVFSNSSNDVEPLIVSAEAAHVTARRHIALVHIPDFIAEPPNEAARELGIHPKALRPIAHNLREAEKCLSSTRQKGGGRQVPIYIAPVPEQAELGGPGPFEITAALGQPRSRQGRARPLLPPGDPASAAVASALSRAGLGDTPISKVRQRVKNLPSRTMHDFPEQAALLSDPWRGANRPRRHPLSPERAPDEAARALVASRKLLERCDEKTATAFAASSLPGRYAAMRRIFEEIKFRMPDFQPGALLDYAAGSGSCMWAAIQVWPGGLRQVTAVEHRPAMVRMGLRFQDRFTSGMTSGGDGAEHAAHSAPVPSIRWLRGLPQAPRSAAQRSGDGRRPPPPDARRYGAVVAAHALTRLAGHTERAVVVRRLWERVAVGGLLVLAEPGSPVGSAFVRQAREQILREECRSEAQLEAAVLEFRRSMPLVAAGVPLQPLLHIAEATLTRDAPSPPRQPAPSTAMLRGSSPSAARTEQMAAEVRELPEGTVRAVEAVAQRSGALAALTHRVLRLQGQVTGAHVVAPCAHDGVCPMDRPGAAGWCHFSQRVERRHLHRQCRARKGISNGPKNWEYERFSFVAIRKAPRRPPAPDVFITPAYREYEEDILDYIAMPPALADAARAGASADLDPLDIFPFFRDGAAADAAAATAERQQREDAAADVAGGGDEGAQTGGGGVWGKGVEEEVEDEEEGEAAQVEEAARAQAALFLDEYLRAMVRDEGAPAAGAIESLRLRMIDAGVLARSDETAEGSGGGAEAGGDVGGDGGGGGGGTGPVGADGLGGHRGHAAAAVGGVRGRHGDVDGGSIAGASSTASVHVPGGAGVVHGNGVESMADVRGPGEQDAQPFMHLGRAMDVQRVREHVAAVRDSSSNANDDVSQTEGHSSATVHHVHQREEKLMLRGRNWATEDPEGVAASRAACASWSRIIRRPLRRGRHVVLDLCVASKDQRSGQVERHIVAHSDRRKVWLGPAAYRLARHAEWGDLWPSIYHRNSRVRTLED